MARHHGDRTLASIAGSLFRRDAEREPAHHAPRHAHSDARHEDAAAQNAAAQNPTTQNPMTQSEYGPIPLSGTCSCGREHNNVIIPGIVGERWFRNVFTQCECGEVVMLTMGRPRHN
jgi:hypothetical protein